MRPTIEEAKRLQKSQDLGHTHLVWLDEGGFTLVHTNHERRIAKARHEEMTGCDIHQYLMHVDTRPVSATGWYVADTVEHAYRFTPLYGICHCGSIQPHLSTESQYRGV